MTNQYYSFHTLASLHAVDNVIQRERRTFPILSIIIKTSRNHACFLVVLLLYSGNKCQISKNTKHEKDSKIRNQYKI